MTRNRKSPYRLSRDQCRNAKPGRHSDGFGLVLVVTQGGSKRWEQRVTIRGRRTILGLGSYPVVSLEDARFKALENLRTAKNGGDPRRPQSAPTFGDMLTSYMKDKGSDYKNETEARDYQNSLEDHAIPWIGGVPVDKIEPLDVREVLMRMVDNGLHHRARTVGQRIGQVLNYSLAHGYAAANPVPSLIKTLPAKPATTHHKALDVDLAPKAFKRGIGDKSISRVEALPRAMAFIMLTASRVNEVIGMTWAEIDWDNQLWHRPAERMKAKKPHTVPLSNYAMGILRKRWDGQTEGLVFQSSRGGKLQRARLGLVLKRMAGDNTVTTHGLRSTFTDWARREGYKQELWDYALAHTHGGVQGAYARDDLAEERRSMMKRWSGYLTTEIQEARKRQRK